MKNESLIISLIFIIFISMINACTGGGAPLPPQVIGGASGTATPTPIPTMVSDDDSLGLSISVANIISPRAFTSRTYINVTATLHENMDHIGDVIWNGYPGNTGSLQVVPDRGAGMMYSFLPVPNLLNITETGNYSGVGRSYNLKYIIQGRLELSGKSDYEYLVIEQDNLYNLIQEYIDFGSDWIPQPKDFDQQQPVFPNLLIQGDSHGVCSRHQYWIVKDLEEKVLESNVLYVMSYLKGINITCGYRCPAGNRRVTSTWYKDSIHLKGLAFDFDQSSSEGNWQLANFCIDPKNNTDVTQVILYDQQDTMYTSRSGRIPLKYEDRPYININGKMVQVEYAHGHIDWRSE